MAFDLATLRRFARAPRGLRRVAWAMLVAFVTLCAVPGSASLVQRSVTAVFEVDCCGCEDDEGVADCEDEQCEDCMACAHPHVVIVMPVSPSFAAAFRPVEDPHTAPGVESVGVRAPPFRPPAS